MNYLQCSRCSQPCEHVTALLAHWEAIHGGVPRAWVVYPTRVSWKQAVGEWRLPLAAG